MFDRVDMVLVRFSTWSAGIFFVSTLVVGFVSNQSELIQRAIIPGVVLAIGVPMLLLDRPRALPQLIATAIAIALFVGFLEPFPNAELGLLAMGLAGVTLIRRRYAPYIVTVGVGLAAVSLWWQGDWGLAVNSALVFVFAGSLFAWMKSELERGQRDFRSLFERYRDLFSNAPIPMWEFDLTETKRGLAGLAVGKRADLPDLTRTARVVAANKEAIALFGPETATDPLQTPLSEEVLREVMGSTSGGDGLAELQVDVDAGTGDDRHLSVTIAPLGRVDEFGPDGVLLSARDITDVVEAARALEKLVESKDQFIATVSHELRTPITAVVGLAQELRDRFDEFDREEIDEFVGLVSDQGADVAHIVEDLLVAARAEVGTLTLQIEEVDLLAMMHTMPTDVSLSSRVDSAVVGADAGRVRQIIRNLLANAVRYGGPNSTVVISTDSDWAYLEVRDDGSPIEPESRERIFDAYQSAGNVPGRTGSVGLGLTVSRQLARLMGGDLTYDHDGSESVFTLRLPLAI